MFSFESLPYPVIVDVLTESVPAVWYRLVDSTPLLSSDAWSRRCGVMACRPFITNTNGIDPRLAEPVIAACWYKNGHFHRDYDLPAIEWAGGDNKSWYRNGQRHRDGDRPAIERANGKSWWKNGERYRDDGLPTIEFTNGGMMWHRDGRLVKELKIYE